MLLACPPAVVSARIARRRSGSSSDDAGRADDTPAQVARKLALFERETRPLVAHYRGLGSTIVELSVAVDTTDDELVDATLRGLDRGRSRARGPPPDHRVALPPPSPYTFARHERDSVSAATNPG